MDLKRFIKFVHFRLLTRVFYIVAPLYLVSSAVLLSNWQDKVLFITCVKRMIHKMCSKIINKIFGKREIYVFIHKKTQLE